MPGVLVLLPPPCRRLEAAFQTVLRILVLTTVLVLATALICAPIQIGGAQAQAQSAVPESHLTFTTIDVPGADVNAVYGINSSGDMVGYYGPNNGSGLDKHGFLYRSGIFTFLDYPGAASTFAYGINDSGLIVGSAEFNGGTTIGGFTYDGVTYSLIQLKGKSSTITYGVNNSAQLVGGAGTLFSTLGFEKADNIVKKLNVPGQHVYVFASGINNAAQLVGWADSDGFMCLRALCRLMDVPGANQTAATGISDGGVIVGWYASSNCICGFALKNGHYGSFGYPGAAGTFAAGINRFGQIVGQYTFDFNSYHGFVTSPIAAAYFERPEAL